MARCNTELSQEEAQQYDAPIWSRSISQVIEEAYNYLLNYQMGESYRPEQKMQALASLIYMTEKSRCGCKKREPVQKEVLSKIMSQIKENTALPTVL